MSALSERWWLVLDLGLLIVLVSALMGYVLGWEAAWKAARGLRERQRTCDDLAQGLARLAVALRALQAALESTPLDGNGSATPAPAVAELRVVAPHPPVEAVIDREVEGGDKRDIPAPTPWWACGASVETSP